MSSSFVHSKRGWRHEAVPLAFIFASAFSSAWLFPQHAVGFVPHTVNASAESSCAFISLTCEEESEALLRARATWQSESGSKSPSVDLSVDRLPEDSSGVVIADPPPYHPEQIRSTFKAKFLPPSLAAESPRTIKSDSIATNTSAEVKLEFSRKDLLTIE